LRLPEHADRALTEELLLRHAGARVATASPSVLAIGLERCDTVIGLVERFGRERVALLHLDRASGAVSCADALEEVFIGGESSFQKAFDIVLLNGESPRSYGLLRRIVRDSARWVGDGGIVMVAGPKKGGAQVAHTALREAYGSVKLLEYRRRYRIFEAADPYRELVDADGADEEVVRVVVRGRNLSLIPDWRVFAKGLLDPATEMLANVFETRPNAAVLDLGCGNGLLGILAAMVEPSSHAQLVDSDPLAVDLARRNAALNGVENVSVHLSDLLSELPDVTFDLILINPPFHRGRVVDLSTGSRFITVAAAALRPGGALYVVANRFLRYEPILERGLGAVEEVVVDRRYKVLRATRR
jgi:16S rRNA (guanine1207-N2)-methyltransferase